MEESIINKKTLIVVFSFLFIRGAAAILGIFREAKDTERPLDYVMEEYDGNMFV